MTHDDTTPSAPFVTGRVLETYQALCAQFPDPKHDDRVGDFDYISGEQVVHRLNEILGPFAWSFSIISHEFGPEDTVLVLGQLTVPSQDGGTIVRQQFGGAKMERKDKGQGAYVSVPRALKSAATDALKKAAQSLGIGLYLAEKDDRGRQVHQSKRERREWRTQKATTAQQQGQQPQQPGPAAQGQPEPATAGKPPIGRDAAAVNPKPAAIACRECGQDLPDSVMLGDRTLARHQFANEGQKRFGKPLCPACFRKAHQETLLTGSAI